jgi:hypothetical protein
LPNNPTHSSPAPQTKMRAIFTYCERSLCVCLVPHCHCTSTSPSELFQELLYPVTARLVAIAIAERTLLYMVENVLLRMLITVRLAESTYHTTTTLAQPYDPRVSESGTWTIVSTRCTLSYISLFRWDRRKSSPLSFILRFRLSSSRRTPWYIV